MQSSYSPQIKLFPESHSQYVKYFISGVAAFICCTYFYSLRTIWNSFYWGILFEKKYIPKNIFEKYNYTHLNGLLHIQVIIVCQQIWRIIMNKIINIGKHSFLRKIVNVPKCWNCKKMSGLDCMKGGCELRKDLWRKHGIRTISKVPFHASMPLAHFPLLFWFWSSTKQILYYYSMNNKKQRPIVL